LFADEGFLKEVGQPVNLKICGRGKWNSRMIVETMLLMLTLISHLK